MFNCALVLLISMWGQRRTGRHAGADRDEEYVRKCVKMLAVVESQYVRCRFVHALVRLTCVAHKDQRCRTFEVRPFIGDIMHRRLIFFVGTCCSNL